MFLSARIGARLRGIGIGLSLFDTAIARVLPIPDRQARPFCTSEHHISSGKITTNTRLRENMGL